MLDEGQGIHFAVAIAKQLHRNVQLHLSFVQRNWLRDRPYQIVIRKARQQLLTSIDDLSQTVKL